MNEDKHTNELDRIDPERLIVQEDDDEVAKFFLVLGVFYNDLKSLLFHLRQLEECFEGIRKDVASSGSGEFGGMKSHLEKLMMATVHEFLNFLEANKSVMNTAEFALVIDSLNQDLQKRFNLIRGIAEREHKQPKTNFAKALWFIRNKTAFHYDPKIISRGFTDYYHGDEKHYGNEVAYYKVGETMATTRFYYCDGAVQRSTRGQIEKFMSFSLLTIENWLDWQV